MDLPRAPQPLLTGDIEGFQQLAELALDVRWSWNHGADEIWKQLDEPLWEQMHSSWGVLQSVSRDRIRHLMDDPTFRRDVESLLEARHREESSDAWFQRAHPESSLTGVAYFSMEFMLSESLPIYSGGLGNVAA
jgi:glycogen phosphorylase